MKRKATGSSTKKSESSSSSKKIRAANEEPALNWPLYFTQLFKIYKTLNTIVAFLSARKEAASSFSSIRTSAEAVLKQPLKLSDIAELKALLPNVIIFEYVPKNQLAVHEALRIQRPGSPDFSQPQQFPLDEQILVLDFAESIHFTKVASLLRPVTSTDTKKVIEKRNQRFVKAVNELLAATSSLDDPCILVQTSAKDYIPQPHQLTQTSNSSSSLAPLPNTSRPSVIEILEDIQIKQWYHNQIKHRHTIPGKEAQLATFDPPLSHDLMKTLEQARGIINFYIHQWHAIQAVAMGKHVIVSTPTASGKSVIYQVPLLRMLEQNSEVKAIFVYPTKALAQDQKVAMQQLLHAFPGLGHVRVDTYDGDTAKEARQDIRENASVIFTNFDTIHCSILPHEDRWRDFLKMVNIFAVDELHYYSGLFGSHVAYIMRRFRRVCAALGNERIRFISCSATIANPLDHMSRIFCLPESTIEVVTEDGAPTASKEFIVWGPPHIDPEFEALGKKNALKEATLVMRFLMERGVRVILFCKTRKVCELAMKTLRVELASEGRTDILERVQSYRGGYNPEDRRRIESDAFNGHLLGLVATNALELGVDIGSLDAVIMLGFPMSLASFRQQAGRAGRRSRDSLAILIGNDASLDNYYMEHPEELFSAPVEGHVIDLESAVIMEAHLQCAAQEMPISDSDDKYFGPDMKRICDSRLRQDKEGWYHAHPKYLPHPSRFISIRGPIEETYIVLDISRTFVGTASILEHIEVSRAVFELYEGGIWLHRGFTFLTQQVDHDAKIAKVYEVDANWITVPRDFIDIDSVQTHRVREMKGSPHLAYYGRVDVEGHVFGFYKIRDGRILDTIDLETLPYHVETTGMWIDISKECLHFLESKGFLPAEGIHSAQHAFLNCFPLSEDAKTECKAAEKEYMSKESLRKRPARLIFYDPHHAGGVVAKAFDNVSNLLHKAEATVSACPCDIGCLKCVFSARCKEKNAVFDKLGALLILRSILNIRIDPDSIPQQVRADPHPVHNTIIPANTIGVRSTINAEENA